MQNSCPICCTEQKTKRVTEQNKSGLKVFKLARGVDQSRNSQKPLAKLLLANLGFFMGPASQWTMNHELGQQELTMTF